MKNHNDEMPRWARRIDECGSWRKRNEEKECRRNGEYIGNIIFSLIFLWVVNKVPDWNLSFINDRYQVVLWMLNVNILIQICGNALILMAGIPVIRYISKIFMEASSFVTAMLLYFVFPFDFTHVHGAAWLNWLLPILLIVGMVVSAAKVVGNFWKLIFWR